MENLIGRTLGQYEILEKVGQGGMAHVFKAHQPNLNRFVAIKVLSPILANDPGFTERFQREAHAVARLNHPNILPVYDSGIQDNYNYIVMRYVPNSMTLSTLMKQDISMDRLIEYMVQVSDALNYAHEQGIIHRDIKPGNVLIDGKWALLADFGLVKDSASASQLTGTGFGMGTPAYMSPEQARGDQVDHRTDIYALGVILHKILTNTIPHDAKTPLAILAKRTSEPVAPIRQIKPDVPESLEHVTLKALAAEPDQRYSTATNFGEALQTAARDPDYREETVISQTIDTEATMMGALDMGNETTMSLHEVATSVEAPTISRPKNIGLMIGGGIAAVVVIGFLLFGLPSFGGSNNNAVTPTLAASNGGNGESSAVIVATTPPTFTPTPLPPTDTPTTAPGTPQAVAKTDLEVLSGPGQNYELLGYLPGGAAAEIVTRDQSGEWWQIKTPLSPGGVGWIKAGDDFVDTFDVGNVAIALAPPTLTPTASATGTSEPPSPTPTVTNTPASTFTPTPQPAAATPAVTTNPLSSPTPTIPTGEIVLLNPASLDEPSFGPTEFTWQWNGPLPEDQGFEVRVWLEGEPPTGVHNSVLDNQDGTIETLDNNTYRLKADITEAAGVRKRRGDYNWTVLLVQITPEYKELGIQAIPGLLRFEPPGSGGGDGGGTSGGGVLSGGD